MLNAVSLVGKIIEMPVPYEPQTLKEYTHIVLQVVQPFAQIDGHYDSDYIKVVLWRGISDEVGDICHEGSTIAIQGRIVSKIREDQTFDTYVMAEKLSFLHFEPKEK